MRFARTYAFVLLLIAFAMMTGACAQIGSEGVDETTTAIEQAQLAKLEAELAKLEAEAQIAQAEAIVAQAEAVIATAEAETAVARAEVAKAEAETAKALATKAKAEAEAAIVAADDAVATANAVRASAPAQATSVAIMTESGEAVIPVIDARAGELLNGISATADPNSNPIFLTKENPLLSWGDLKLLIEANGIDWYAAEVNRLHAEGFISFSWDDVQRYAQAEEDLGLTSDQSLVIQVYGDMVLLSDLAIRDQAARVVGQELANTLVIVRQTNGSTLVNTRGMANQQLNPFGDYRSMVRVSLTPFIFEGDKIVGRSGSEGVFVDCTNVWALRPPKEPPPVTTTTKPTVTTTTKPTVTTTTKPDTTTTTTVPVVTTTTLPKEEKDPCESVVSRPSHCEEEENDDPRDDPEGEQPPRATTTTTIPVVVDDPPADSGSGATDTTTPPTTQAPAPAPPVTTSPTVPITAP